MGGTGSGARPRGNNRAVLWERIIDHGLRGPGPVLFHEIFARGLTFPSRGASFKTLQYQHCRYNVPSDFALIGMPSSRSTRPSLFLLRRLTTPPPFLVSIPSTFPPSPSRDIAARSSAPPTSPSSAQRPPFTPDVLLVLLVPPLPFLRSFRRRAFYPSRGRRHPEIHGGVCPFFVHPTLPRPSFPMVLPCSFVCAATQLQKRLC